MLEENDKAEARIPFMEIFMRVSIVCYLHENDLKLDVKLRATAATNAFLIQIENGENVASRWRVENSIRKAKCLMNSLCMKYS